MQGAQDGGGRTQAEDLRQLVELLWATPAPPRPGRRRAVALDDVVGAAMELADRDGLDSVTVRAVAASLGRSPMSLYSYVSGKDSLLVLMYDRALGELPAAHAIGQGWRAAMEAAVRCHWELYQRHPWMLQVSTARTGLGPNSFRALEALAAVLHAAGLGPADVHRAAGAAAAVVQASARATADVRAATLRSGLVEADWWSTVEPALEAASGHVDWAERYPTLTGLADARAFEQLDRDPDDATDYLEYDAAATFAYTMARFLDGIQTAVGDRDRPADPTRPG